MIKLQAREQRTADQARGELEERQVLMDRILAQVSPFWRPPSNPRLVDIGCAQGTLMIAAARRGFEVVGVEPWEGARQVAREVAAEAGVNATVLDGVAERLPLDDESIDFVLANSVIEHVEDAEQMVREMYRVCKPGGVVWFSGASAMCPWQNEIHGFPMFGWYPLSLKRKLMRWAATHRPELVGHTTRPAIHWLTPGLAQKMLRNAGFRNRVYDYWDLRMESQGGRLHGIALRLIKAIPPAKLAAHVLVSACAYSTVK